MGFSQTSAFRLHAREIGGIDRPIWLLLLAAVKVSLSDVCKSVT